MNTGSWLNYPAGSGSSSSSHPFPSHVDDDVHDRARHPKDLSFLGPLPLSHDQAIQDFSVWNCSTQGSFPSQPLRGPGQAGFSSSSLPDHPLPAASHKRKRTTSPEPPTMSGCRPRTGGLVGESDRMTMDPPPAIKFTERKNSAYDIWVFVRALMTDKDLPPELWPNDCNRHLTKRPDTSFVGCKLCTQFGNSHGIKMWKVFNNGEQTSPTSTLRKHFLHEHCNIWESECRHLNVPQKTATGQTLGSSVEPFTRDGLIIRLQRFIVGDDQSINVIENSHFRELLLYLGQGHVTDDEIPGRTYLTESIIKAWKRERELFYQEMEKSLGHVSLTTDAWSDPDLVSFLGATAHFIVRDGPDSQLILRSGLLAFRHIWGSHTGENLARILYKIIKGARIEQKIGSITADNASNNDTMMEHLGVWFARDNIPFDRHGNRVCCFPHVINLAVQAIYAALKDGKGLEKQYLLGNLGCISEAALKGMVLPEGVTRDNYLRVLKADVLGVARKLITACRISGKRREEFVDTILGGNIRETWVDDDGNFFSRKALQLLRDCDTRWSSTHLMVDRVLVMLPVIKVFVKRPNLLEANIVIPNAAEACVLDHIRAVTSVPHDAQESLSSEHTPTLSYSLPFYHSIVDDWEHLEQVYPLLSPFIKIGIRKVEEYVNKSKLSRTYLLAVLLNPCLKMKWIEKNCSTDDVQRTRQMALDAMLAFKMADLEAQRDSSFYAYTTAPTHHLKSITASAVRFLDRNTSRTSPPAQPADVTLSCPPPCAGTGERNTVLDGLHFELDCYLHEPRMDHFKATTRGSEPGIIVVWCDPLLYWQGAEKRFPYLFRLAMDVLPVQASAVACERLFSSSKETCTPRRNRINPDLMEALQILKYSFRSGTLDLAGHVDDTLYLGEQNSA